MLETNASGVPQVSYELAQGELISQTRSGSASYYLPDGQGSVRALANSSGTITDTYNYDAFGKLANSTGTTANTYLYTGQQFDSVTGLYDLRARYYNPALGRFLSRDTAGLLYGNPIELNRYGYTANNPINGRDPTGLQSQADYSLLVVGAVAVVLMVGCLYYCDRFPLLMGLLADLEMKLIDQLRDRGRHKADQETEDWLREHDANYHDPSKPYHRASDDAIDRAGELQQYEDIGDFDIALGFRPVGLFASNLLSLDDMSRQILTWDEWYLATGRPPLTHDSEPEDIADELFFVLEHPQLVRVNVNLEGIIGLDPDNDWKANAKALRRFVNSAGSGEWNMPGASFLAFELDTLRQNPKRCTDTTSTQFYWDGNYSPTEVDDRIQLAFCTDTLRGIP